MGLREAWQAHQERNELLEQKVFSAFDRAVDAAKAGDPVAEERALYEAVLAARTLGPTEEKNTLKQIDKVTRQGLIRRSHWIGYAANVSAFSDRIVVFEPDHVEVHRMDTSVRASTETAGNFFQTTRPTLTRMALTTWLPGTVLAPGLALAKKSTHDLRELYFIIEHPEWAHVAKLDPDAGLGAREVAAAVNSEARGCARVGPSWDGVEVTSTDGPTPATDPLSTLKQLGELHEAGVLTDDEFQERKRKLLSRLDRTLDQ